MADDAGPFDRTQCLALMGSVSLGRVVFTHRAMPAVHPVRFVLRDDAVVFAVARDSVLYAGARDAVVAFEVDEFAGDLEAGWYVSLLGRAVEVPADAAGLACPGPGRRYLSVPAESVTGRRLNLGRHHGPQRACLR